MRRGFEKARRTSDSEGKGTGQDGRIGRRREVRREKEVKKTLRGNQVKDKEDEG